jgi:hypothetical protein
MHYRNGREARNGDHVVQLDGARGKITFVGVLYDAVAGNDYCNGSLFDPQTRTIKGACLIDCLHADDLAAILTEKGLDKRPAGRSY